VALYLGKETKLQTQNKDKRIWWILYK